MWLGLVGEGWQGIKGGEVTEVTGILGANEGLWL